MPVRGVIRHESVTVSTTAMPVTLTVGHGFKPQAAVITVENAAIRFCVDGTTATTSVGHEAEDGDVIELTDAGQVNKFSAISRDGGTATLRVTQGVEYVS